MIICIYYSNRSLPSQAEDTPEAAEEPDRKSQLSQDTVHGYKTRELDRERRLDVPQSDKMSKEHAEFPTRDANIYSLASELRESYHRGSSRSGEGFHYSTADVESIGRSGHDLAGYTRDNVQRASDPWSLPSYQSRAGDVEGQSFYSRNVTEYPRSGVSAESGRRWTVYDHSANAPRQQQSYRHPAGDADDFNSDMWSSNEVQRLESWHSGSKDEDVRNYRGYQRGNY